MKQEMLKVYEMYNIIYKKRKENPLYRNLKNENLNIEEIAIAISSLITKMLISYSMIDDFNERKKFVEANKIKNLSEAIIEYTVFNKEEKLLNCSKEIREFLKRCFKNKKINTNKIATKHVN